MLIINKGREYPNNLDLIHALCDDYLNCLHSDQVPKMSDCVAYGTHSPDHNEEVYEDMKSEETYEDMKSEETYEDMKSEDIYDDTMYM